MSNIEELISTQDPLKNSTIEDAAAAAAAAAASILNDQQEKTRAEQQEDEAAIAAAVAAATDTSAMIAEATAAAIEAAAVGEVDVSAAANAAALAAANAATLVDAADVPMSVPDDSGNTKKNDQRRKRYKERTFDEIEAEYGGGDDDISMTSSQKLKNPGTHEDQLAARRLKDRQRYAHMTGEQRHAYNMKRREQYHRQSEISRQRRRERERNRYHALQMDDAKDRNNRRAKLERERYQKLSSDELESKNRKRRERAALSRQKKEAEKVCLWVAVVVVLCQSPFFALTFPLLSSLVAYSRNG